MSIFTFKKPQASSTSVGPACVTFDSHLATIRLAVEERTKINARMNHKKAAVAAGNAAVEDAGAEVQRAQSVIDARMADAHRAGLSDPDLTSERQTLAAAKSQLSRRKEIHRGTANAQTSDQTLLNSINQQLQALNAETFRLQHPAIVEEAVAPAPELLAAAEVFISIRNKIFAHVVLADQLSSELRLGQYMGSQLYSELNLALPNHPAFQRGSTDPWTAQQERNAEWRAVNEAAAKLNHVMLTGETKD